MKTTTTYRQKDSGWQIIVSWKDENGRWRQKSKQGFPLKKDAKEAEADLISSIKKLPRPVESGMADITLKEFCDVWLKNNLSLVPGSKRQYKTAVKALGRLAEKPLRLNDTPFLPYRITLRPGFVYLRKKLLFFFIISRPLNDTHLQEQQPYYTFRPLIDGLHITYHLQKPQK